MIEMGKKISSGGKKYCGKSKGLQREFCFSNWFSRRRFYHGIGSRQQGQADMLSYAK
jgi:hypothetical protein